MKYLAAYALLTLSGKKDITANDIKGVLGGVQASINDDDINRVIASLKGKSIHQLIAEGAAKIGGAPTGGQASKGKEEKAPAAKETKKEEPKKKQQPKKKEQAPKEEEEDFGLGGGLFD